MGGAQLVTPSGQPLHHVAHAPNPKDMAFVNSDEWRPHMRYLAWTQNTGVRLIQPGDYPTHFAILEDPPVFTGGRHEYTFRTLHCDRHVDLERGTVRGGCDRPAPIPPAERYAHRQKMMEAAIKVMTMGANMHRAYLQNPIEGADWLPAHHLDISPATDERQEARDVWLGDECRTWEG